MTLSGDMSSPPGTPPGQRLGWRPVPRPRPISLSGAHVLVRPVQATADAEELYRVSHPPEGDSDIWTYLFHGPYADAGALRDWLAGAQQLDDPLFFTLVRRADGRPAGVASYMRITPEHGVIEIGNIWFGATLQRTTAATEAIFLLAHHAFELGYRRLEWKCNALNAGSRRAAERFGFTFEGVFRQHMVVKDRNRDTAWYAITDQDWPAISRGFERWLYPGNFDAAGRQRQSLGDLVSQARSG